MRGQFYFGPLGFAVATSAFKNEDNYLRMQMATVTSGSRRLDAELKVGLAAELNYFKIPGYSKFDRDPNVHISDRGQR